MFCLVDSNIEYILGEMDNEKERTKWNDLVASSTVNYNILMSRRGQELVGVKQDLMHIKQMVNDYSEEKKVEILNKIQKDLDKLGEVIKDVHIHISYVQILQYN